MYDVCGVSGGGKRRVYETGQGEVTREACLSAAHNMLNCGISTDLIMRSLPSLPLNDIMAIDAQRTAAVR